jgi:hypothetical protein
VAEEVESASHEMEIELSPLVEEIAISSVTQLRKIGVKFRPTEGGLGIWDLYISTRILLHFTFRLFIWMITRKLC